MALEAGEFAIAGIDRKDLARVAPALEGGQRAAAGLVGVPGGTHDGDRSRVVEELHARGVDLGDFACHLSLLPPLAATRFHSS